MLNNLCIHVCVSALAINSLLEYNYKAMHFKSVALASTIIPRLKIHTFKCGIRTIKRQINFFLNCIKIAYRLWKPPVGVVTN